VYAAGAKVKRELIVSLLVLVAVAAGIAVTSLVIDIHNDRQYTVKVTGKVLVYDADTPSGIERGEVGVIETLRPPDRVRVMRVVSHGDFQAIKIRLNDGREGYIFCCQNFDFSK
jgi:hypothetical protein